MRKVTSAGAVVEYASKGVQLLVCSYGALLQEQTLLPCGYVASGFTLIFAICSSIQTSAEAQKQKLSGPLHANRNGSICCTTLCPGRVYGLH